MRGGSLATARRHCRPGDDRSERQPHARPHRFPQPDARFRLCPLRSRSGWHRRPASTRTSISTGMPCMHCTSTATRGAPRGRSTSGRAARSGPPGRSRLSVVPSPGHQRPRRHPRRIHRSGAQRCRLHPHHRNSQGGRVAHRRAALDPRLRPGHDFPGPRHALSPRLRVARRDSRARHLAGRQSRGPPDTGRNWPDHDGPRRHPTAPG